MFEDENGNRPGDWMHKNQRTRESANNIVKDPHAKKWYQETFWIVVLLLVFWPAGIVLAWKSDWPLAAKVIVSVVVAAYAAIAAYSVWVVPDGISG